MTSPRVIELPRRLEPVARDTFLGNAEVDHGGALRSASNVVSLVSRDALGLRRPSAPQRPAAA